MKTFAPILSSIDDPKNVVQMATFGLLEMSQGNHQAGISAYEIAIQRANEMHDTRTAVRASLNLLISMVDISRSIDTRLLEQTTKHLRDTTDAASLGTAMNLARRLSRQKFLADEVVDAAAKEFTSAIKEGGGRLLGSIFRESVQEATKEISGSQDAPAVLEGDHGSV